MPFASPYYPSFLSFRRAYVVNYDKGTAIRSTGWSPPFRLRLLHSYATSLATANASGCLTATLSPTTSTIYCCLGFNSYETVQYIHSSAAPRIHPFAPRAQGPACETSYLYPQLLRRSTNEVSRHSPLTLLQTRSFCRRLEIFTFASLLPPHQPI